MTVGTLESNDVVVDADGVSRVHAVFERFGDAWCVRDLGSRNGTFVNGGRIIGERALHSGDEIVLGRLRLLFHGPARGRETAAIAQAPPLTQRERDVLLALCRPLLTGRGGRGRGDPRAGPPPRSPGGAEGQARGRRGFPHPSALRGAAPSFAFAPSG